MDYICLLHLNELLLRHLIPSIDGKSSRLTSYTEDIGQNLKGPEKLSIVAFNSIECNFPDIDSTTVSSDQKYLFDIAPPLVLAVSVFFVTEICIIS